MEYFYEQLAIAIVEQAVRDYAKALIVLHRDPDDEAAWRIRLEAELFFRSRWLTALTTVPGSVLMGYGRKIAVELIENDMRRKRCTICGAFID